MLRADRRRDCAHRRSAVDAAGIRRQRFGHHCSSLFCRGVGVLARWRRHDAQRSEANHRYTGKVIVCTCGPSVRPTPHEIARRRLASG